MENPERGPWRPARGTRPLRAARPTLGLRQSVVTLVTLGVVFAAALQAPRPAFHEGLAFSKSLVDTDGRFLRLAPAADGRYRVWLTLGEFSPLLVSATRIELAQGGADPRCGISRSLARRRLGEAPVDGESFLSRARLRLEAWRLRVLYGPDELLEAYLNLSSYGPGIEGAGAASLVYFGKNPDQLNMTEALQLSVIPDHPIRMTLTGLGDGSDRRERRTAAARVRSRLPQRPNSTGAVAVTIPAAKVADRTNAFHMYMGKE